MWVNYMRWIILTIIFLACFALSVKAQNCKYDKNGIEEPPFVWMANKLVPKTIRKIKGKVTDRTQEPIVGAVISVFQLNENGAKFIGSNETDEKGRFCFGNLKKGKYAIKVGHKYFQLYEIDVNLEPKNKKAERELAFELDVGY